jgi:transposase
VGHLLLPGEGEAARHRLSKFLLRHGRLYNQGIKWTKRHWVWMRTQTFDRAAAHAAFDHYLLQIRHLEERLRALEQELAQLAASPAYRPAVDRLTCLRRISQLSAISLLAELQDFRRFEHLRQLMAFIGLVPSERSSGLKERPGHITKTGNSHARRLLIEAAWSYRHPPALGPRVRRLLPGQPAEIVALVEKAQVRLHKRYRRLVARGKRSPVAVTAVARELCGFLWALMAQAA